jgi:outer membrane protein assembly factor BamD (BamD/ComL family)
MSAFSSGSYEAADVLFRSFERRFPTDSRQEDVAFIRIVIGSRRMHAADAQRMARAYLARYPTGLRRNEVEGLLVSAERANAGSPLSR